MVKLFTIGAKRHVKIKVQANPYLQKDAMYFMFKNSNIPIKAEVAAVFNSYPEEIKSKLNDFIDIENVKKKTASGPPIGRYGFFGGTAHGLFDGSHRVECGRRRKDDRFLFEST